MRAVTWQDREPLKWQASPGQTPVRACVRCPTAQRQRAGRQEATPTCVRVLPPLALLLLLPPPVVPRSPLPPGGTLNRNMTAPGQWLASIATTSTCRGHGEGSSMRPRAVVCVDCHHFDLQASRGARAQGTAAQGSSLRAPGECLAAIATTSTCKQAKGRRGQRGSMHVIAWAVCIRDQCTTYPAASASLSQLTTTMGTAPTPQMVTGQSGSRMRRKPCHVLLSLTKLLLALVTKLPLHSTHPADGDGAVRLQDPEAVLAQVHVVAQHAGGDG